MTRIPSVRAMMASVGLAALVLTSPMLVPHHATAQQMQTLPSIADLADKLLPSVVEISVESKAAGGQSGMPDLPPLPDDSPFKDFFEDFFKRRQGPGEGGGGNPQGPGGRTVNSMGSGFIIDPSGLIVTNNHVVEGAESIQVHMQDNTIMKAELVGRDPKTDLAVLRVKPDKPLPSVKFGDSDKLRIGEWVIAMGNPFGLGGSVSLGIVSARNRDINAGPYDDFIQTDAAINKGNSGGPLFNLNGEVVGINTAIFSPTGYSVGIAFSISSNAARGVVDQLTKYGETRRGWLGVKVQTLTDDIAENLKTTSRDGALVADVTEGSPGKAAGIQAGDIIIEFNGKPIKEMRELPRAVASTEVGANVVVKVLRKGEQLSLNVTIGRLEDGEKLVEAQDNKAKSDAPAVVTVLGMTVSSLNDQLRNKYKTDEKLKGAIITEVAKEGAASDKGLEPGDIILEAGGKPVEGASDINVAIEASEKAGKSSVLLLIAKGGQAGETRFIALKIKK